MRLSDRGNNLRKGEGINKLQEEKGMSLTEESVPGKDSGRILNSEHSRHPALIIILDTRCEKIIFEILNY